MSRPTRLAIFFLFLLVALLLMSTAVQAQHPALGYSSMRFVDASTGSTVDSKGNFYYVDSSVVSTKSLVRLAADGTEALRVPLGGLLPEGMVADDAGDVFMVADCFSSCPVANTVFGTATAASAGFLVKVGPTGTVVFVDQFANAGAAAVAVDSIGNIYVAGISQCGLATTPGSFQTDCPINGSAFAAKIDASGRQLVYSTYLHGTAGGTLTALKGIAVDASGSLYVAGFNAPTDWPTTPGAFESVGIQGGSIITKLKPDGSGLAYSTFLNEGGIMGIAVDGVGQLYVTGTTFRPDFPTTAGSAEPTSSLATCTSFGCTEVGFVLKLNVGGTGLVYSSYVNFMAASHYPYRQSFNGPLMIAVDSAGSAYIAGEAFVGSPTVIPTVNAIQSDLDGGADVALLKLNPQGSAYVFLSYLGGPQYDYPTGFGIDANGAMYVAGVTLGTFPALTVTLGGPDGCCWGPRFIAKIVPSATAGVAVLWPEDSISALNPNTFGQQVAVGSSVSKAFFLSNYGAAPLPVGSFSLDDPQFTQTNNCGASLAIGAHCDVAVTFRPTASGRFGPTLTARDPSGGVLRTLLLDAIATAPVVSLSPSALTFGPQAVGTSSAAQTITITNTGNGDLTFGSITISGDFSATNTCSGPIGPNGTCAIRVSFVPTVSGQRSGSITLTSNAVTTTTVITLTGGVTPDFSVAPPAGGTTSQTINAGQTATYNLSLTPTAGFSGTVALSCSGAPQNASCAVNPVSVSLSGTATTAFTVSVITAARSATSTTLAAGVLPRGGGWAGWWIWIALGLGSVWFVPKRRRVLAVLRPLSLLAMVALLVMIGCGGGSKTTPPPVQTGTPAGTYTIVVSAASGSTTHTQNLTLIVN